MNSNWRVVLRGRVCVRGRWMERQSLMKKSDAMGWSGLASTIDVPILFLWQWWNILAANWPISAGMGGNLDDVADFICIYPARVHHKVSPSPLYFYSIFRLSMYQPVTVVHCFALQLRCSSPCKPRANRYKYLFCSFVCVSGDAASGISENPGGATMRPLYKLRTTIRTTTVYAPQVH